MEIDSSEQKQVNCIQKISSFIVNSLEQFFYRYGRSVASHPWRYVLACVLFTGLSSLGFLNTRVEHRPERLWIPQNSDYVKTLDWQKQNFPDDHRLELILYEADNVLTADYVREMFRIHEQLASIVITNSEGQNFTQRDLCVRVPALGGKQRDDLLRMKAVLFPDHDLSMEKDWSLVVDKNIYYHFYSRMPTACLEISILEMWGYNASLLATLTDHDVIHAINNVKLSATFSYPMEFESFLGGVVRNASGHITGARTALAKLLMKIDKARVTGVVNHAGLAQEVDPEVYAWEGAFIAALMDTSSPQGLEVYFQSQRSFNEISADTVMGDVTFLVVGVTILFIYVQLMLGKFNMVENRPVLSVLGLLATYMAVIVAFGLCSAVGLLYGPVHNILPLLMIGLGVDDMFVIVQCWQNLDHQERQLELRKRMGHALRHAGVAITVTSLTDIAAFLIGSTTVLPALRSFCIYAAVGVLVLYFFQATFFVACFTYDQTRLEDNRNGLLWCYKHKKWTPNKCSQVDLSNLFFDKLYSKVLLKKPTKVLVLLVTAGLLGVSIWGVTNLQQYFDPVLFIPQSSYLFHFLSKLMNFYPEAGEMGTVYFGGLNYSQELYKVGELVQAMERSEGIASVTSWYDLMADYTKKDIGEDIRGKELNETFFHEILSSFLFSPSGARFHGNFLFDGDLAIAQPAPNVLASKFEYRHKTLEGRSRQIEAMEHVKKLVKDAQFSDVAAATAYIYSSWETNKLIMVELVRNLCLAMVAVCLMTLILLANIVASCFVLLSVALTLINVMALMTWWGLTIDIITCINLVLSIGLCVDYSAHIALHFMQVQGSRDERARCALREMGPAVVNGAFSTFLSFVLLANSDSHVFLSFFKIFFGVFIYGVFHGLVFLPVLLSLLGPAAYIKPHHLPGRDEDNDQHLHKARENLRPLEQQDDS